MSESKKVLVVMTGSIACYKVCHVISRLVQAQVEVQVVASPAALQFVGAATLEGLSGRPVISDMYAAGNVMEHIHLMRWADLILVAPGTANFINKAAQGVGDDLVQTLFLAHDFKRPFLVAPAMNVSMYSHPATQKSLQALKEMGVKILDTASGILACGEEGWGRLLDPELILEACLEGLKLPGQIVKGPVSSLKIAQQPIKVLVTAGGTQEPIDTVRTISNLSTGRTGIQIAEYFDSLGFDVTLLKAHSGQSSHLLQQQSFTSFASLDESLQENLKKADYDFVIHTAAVSDYSLENIEVAGRFYKPMEVRKLNSQSDKISLHLKRNHKIINKLQEYSRNPDVKIIAFKLTSGASPESRLEAVRKLQTESQATWIVHNDLTEIDLQKKQHLFTLYSSDLKSETCDGITELCRHLSQTLLKEKL
jgi:phosphopantothenoylcysteine decarboxylase/phosphopantothenate--cysteine ligase